MKRFWVNVSEDNILFDGGPLTVLRSDESGLLETDYRGSEPREIQSAEYNPETGRIKLVPKEPVREKTFAEKMAFFFAVEFPREWLGKGGQISAIETVALVKQELEREKQQPANPYTKEAVDELLDALRDCLGPSYADVDYWVSAGSRRSATAAQALLRQREAEKAGA